jgi:HPt (histidine-containing phosphotransfer) domain-containing protein
MDGYVSKPIRDRELFLAIEQALKAHAPQLLPPSPESTQNGLSAEGPMPEYNEHDALERCGDDRGLMRELIDMFLVELPKWTAALESSLASGDAVLLNRTAHSIKGAVSTFGADPARLAAFALEAAAKHGQLQDAPRLLAELKEALNRLVPALSAFKP